MEVRMLPCSRVSRLALALATGLLIASPAFRVPALFAAPPDKASASPPNVAETQAQEDAAKEHQKLFVENRYPSATACRTCHPSHFDEWSVSQHAYAQLSPVFNAMHGKIVKLTNGTNGDFCTRCHTQVGMNLGESVYMSNMDRHPTSREGITCVICHRLSREYGKVSGRFALDEGTIFNPVRGPKGNEELKRVLANPDQYKVVTDPKQQGRAIHTDVIKFPFITSAAFCGSCHDVTLNNGFRLEEAFSE